MSTLLTGAHQVVTCRGPSRARRGREMADLDVVQRGSVLIGDNGLIEAVGSFKELRSLKPDAEIQEVDGVLFPGFVDCHTHAVFGAARLADHERRARGISYKEIAAAGGGILASVNDVRGRDESQLLELMKPRLAALVANGTTTVEVKSGYGLELAAELAQLEAVRRASLVGLPSLVPTFLGAHEVPPEARADPDGYVSTVVDEMLPAVQQQGVARFCDVFCEPGVFTIEQSRRVLEAAQRHGLGLKLHADEIDYSGGAQLAAELGAVSADHLAAVSESGIEVLSGSSTIAVLLPGTMLFLGSSSQAPARRMVDAGVAVALATDFNPGSSPGLSLPLMATLGVSQMRLLPAETIIAITVNGAAAVGEAHARGQIAPGFRADLVLASARDWRELPYWYGTNLISEVWIEGAACHPRQWPVNCLG
ncbi:MAG: imidazolonepropionase [Gemmatimonadota bacterium]|nr:MAG: imidazolonepropionase [Gemmatimonadota bacterium]